ncbi:hypothetical protein BHE74_00036054 [Ensete ventricosum]|nr:hypothetical protein BHE74_00036054 [Ensete ventricosum]RZS00190.1 hypothetical protein BHM03_00029852 [Ensete ventricosum]
MLGGWMAATKAEEQQDAKNTTVMLSDRTLTDSKIEVDLYRGSVLLEHYMAEKLQVLLFFDIMKITFPNSEFQESRNAVSIRSQPPPAKAI